LTPNYAATETDKGKTLLCGSAMDGDAGEIIAKFFCKQMG